MMKDSFLLDEVRCGFLVPAVIKQAWAAQLEVLWEIDRVCKMHGIMYFADWGTLLGCVRHGGYVPWDDDLDIVMKRADYERFLTVAAKDMAEGFHVQTYKNQEDMWLFMGKVVGRNSFCFEKEHLRKFHNSPYIPSVDVFVLDYVYQDEKREDERKEDCMYLLSTADGIVNGKFSESVKELALQEAEKRCGKKLPRIADAVEMGRYLYGEVEKKFAEVPEKEATMLTQLFPWGLTENAQYYPKEYYESVIELPFEYGKIPVPIMYDMMLRKRYGQYMRSVRDGGAHDYPFFEGQKKNLQAVLPFALPEFVADKEKLHRSREEGNDRQESYKSILTEAAEELRQQRESIGSLLGRGETAQVGALLQGSQELAINMGEILEQLPLEKAQVIRLLEQYCELIYRVYEWMLGGMAEEGEALQKLSAMGEALEKSLRETVFERESVVFFPVLACDFKWMERLWKKEQENGNNVLVVPLPYYYKDYDGSPKEICCDAADFPEYVNPLDYRSFTPEFLAFLHPEKIVIQNPYDSWHPGFSVGSAFYTEKIRKYTDCLLYIPPFVVEEYSKQDSRAYGNMKYYVTMPGVVYADKVLVQSENMRQLYIEKLCEFVGEDSRELWKERIICAKEPAKEEKAPNAGKKRMLYGISVAVWLEDNVSARKKIEENLKIFAGYASKMETDVFCYPECEEMQEAKKWLEKQMERYRGVRLLEKEPDHIDVYAAYYGDGMPRMMEFICAHKPVMQQNVFCRL